MSEELSAKDYAIGLELLSGKWVIEYDNSDTSAARWWDVHNDCVSMRCYTEGHAEWLRDTLNALSDKAKRGDYVLATKYGDGGPCDYFHVGFVSGFTKHEEPRYMIVDCEGNNQRGNGFRRAEKITPEEGRQLIALFPEISDIRGRSLWWHLAKIRGEENPVDPCELSE